VNFTNNEEIIPTSDSDKIQAHIISRYDRKLRTHKLRVERTKSMDLPYYYTSIQQSIGFVLLSQVDKTKSMDLPYNHTSI